MLIWELPRDKAFWPFSADYALIVQNVKNSLKHKKILTVIKHCVIVSECVEMKHRKNQAEYPLSPYGKRACKCLYFSADSTRRAVYSAKVGG